MSRYASVVAGAPVVTAVVQSASPEDLQERVTEAIAALPVGFYITAITLAGAGDGHEFFVTIEAADGADTGNFGLLQAQVRCYMAAQQEALSLARAGVTPPNAALVDSQSAGASDGARVMGLLVYGDLQGQGQSQQEPPNASEEVDISSGNFTTAFASTKYLYVGGGGNVAYRLREDLVLRLLTNVPGGQMIEGDFLEIGDAAAGTTAADMLLWAVV